VHRRCTWLNGNVFSKEENQISSEAINAVAALGLDKAMELLKEVETKGSAKISNPSGYLKAAARRALNGEDGRSSKRARGGT